MATQAQLDEKLRAEAESSAKIQVATPAQLAEKARFGQSNDIPYATPAQLAEKARRTGAPALPPRGPSTPAPPYSDDDAKRSELISNQWRSHDPRSSSTHSLVPSESGRDGRRTLLLVYIHGFMGNETSFQSFPAHVHNLLTITLSETHVVHTKIYPRYKSRKDIAFARDDFGIWLEPHENSYTDVILLGHSMGGLLSAEVVLQKPLSFATGKPFQHRILGTISFDTPFLGMHPGVVVSGIGSLFRPASDPAGGKPAQSSGANTPNAIASAASSSYAPSTIVSDDSSSNHGPTSPLSRPPTNDPYFNPPFPNDVRLPERKGWSSLLHFVTKHSDGLTNAATEYFKSHLEFGGCMADYSGLQNRYDRIRALEDVDDRKPSGLGDQAAVRRVRFVNYYTASTGRPKKPKVPPGFMIDKDGLIKPIEEGTKDIDLEDINRHTPVLNDSDTIEQAEVATTTSSKLDDSAEASAVRTEMETLGEHSGVQDDVQEPPEMRHIDSMPIEDDDFVEPPTIEKTADSPEEEATVSEPTTSEFALPPIPPMPTEPEPTDFSVYKDKDARKVAEKEHKRVTKAYQQAVKDRESAIKDRKKLVEKREKKERQEREKCLKAEEKQRLKEEKEEEKRRATINPEPRKERQASASASAASSIKDDKPKRDRKFCMLPPEYAGKRDKCWIRVYMEGVDEVGAHCGLFFQGPQYESLVGDVGARIDKWVHENTVKIAASSTER